MFRRLFLWLGLLLLAFLSALAALGIVWRGPGDERGWLVVMLLVGVALLLTRMLCQRSEARLNLAIERVRQGLAGLGQGDGRHVFGAEELRPLVDAFNLTSERLALHIGQLEEDRQQLRTILSSMEEGVVALGPGQLVLFANERASRLLETPLSSLVGRKLWETVRQRSLLDIVQRALTSTQPQQEEVLWNDGERSLTVRAARLPGAREAGSPARGVVVVLHDTTELRRLERLRQEFVANVSHELKTPLSVIKACIETLLDGAIEDVAHRGSFLEQVAFQSDRLHALILDLLSLARIESGDAIFEFVVLPIRPLVQECLDTLRTRAEAKHQTLSLVEPTGEELNLTAWADEEAVIQILNNLLDNAVKYTPEGGQIQVTWRREGECVALEVSDTGIGIPETDLPHIFERFYRVDKARSRELGGTGLGLSIVKHLVQAMEGTVRATSKLGQGTTFVVCLPQARQVPGLGKTTSHLHQNITRIS
jgi:two-component system phosphate regulon sensor histidine kinase PhoR